MSETQKVFASVSGAVVAHVLLLVLVFLMLDSSVGAGISTEPPASPAPKEVTIMMSDLMERIETEPAEPEPEPEVAEEAQQRYFFPTESNAPEVVAPEDPKFVSDRNTSAAAMLMPDPNQPQNYGPTTQGDSPLDALRLRDQEYVDGKLNDPPASNQATATASPATRPGENSHDATAARVGSETEAGEMLEKVEGADLPPENQVSDLMRRPEASDTDGTDSETMVRESFTVPNGMQVGNSAGQDEEDLTAPKAEESEAEIGSPTDVAEKAETVAGMENATGENEEGNDLEDATAGSPGESMPSGDVGLFAEGFNPEERMTTSNGTISNLGENAVDAEATAAGKYQAAVRLAIAKKWHAYRAQNGDFVTYGFLKVKCRIDRYGKVHDLRIEENKANSVMADFSLRAILDADLPPMTEEVADEFGPKGLELDYDIIIY